MMWYDKMLKKGRKSFLSYLNNDLIRDKEIQTTIGELDQIMNDFARFPQEALIMFNRVGEIRWNGFLFYVKGVKTPKGDEFIRFYEIEKIISVGDYGGDEIDWSDLVGPKRVDPNDQFHSSSNKPIMSEESAIWYQYESEYFTKWLDISSWVCRRFVKDSPVGTEINEDTALNILVIPRQSWPNSVLYHDSINKKVI
jgi:hypothetical protein